MKPKTIDSIIEELCPNIFITDHYKDKKDKCKKQLIELFMSCVPEKKVPVKVCMCDCLPCKTEENGCEKCEIEKHREDLKVEDMHAMSNELWDDTDVWNDCRDQMIKNLEGLK